MADILLDTLFDALKTIPFLILAYIIIELIEHRAKNKFEKFLSGFGRNGAAIGALLGVVPQCGFSVAAANLYANRIITAGTLLAIYISTSDEAIPVLLSSPEGAVKIIPLILSKVFLAIVAGTLIDKSGMLKAPEKDIEYVEEMHSHCHTDDDEGLVRAIIRHTAETFVFILIVMLSLNIAIFYMGEDRLAAFMMDGSVFQPVLAGLVGLIPNCAASVVIAQLFAEGALSFGSALAGLSTSAGLGLIMLLRADVDKKEILKIALLLFIIPVAVGMVLQVIGL